MSAAAGALRRVESRVPRALARIAAVRPAYVLAGLVAVQWIAVLALALSVQHNGWVYYQGGDQLWYYTSGLSLVHGHLPYPLVGYGWSLLLGLLALPAGANLASALPAIVVLNVLVLLPVALLCVFGIARRIGGRLFGYWAAALWIAVPLLGIRFVNLGYHQKWTELTLPQGLGLTAMADFPSMVALLVAALFTIRAVERSDLVDGAIAGLAAGFGVATKPSNAIFLAAPAVALVAGRAWRPLGAAVAGAIPALVTLTLWKYRGYGDIPLLAAPATRVAAGTTVVGSVGDYVHLNWHQLHLNMLQVREHFWSARVVEWLVVAGAIGLLRKSVHAGLLVVLWFGSFVVVKGTFTGAGLEDASLLRLLLPAAPAFVLLLAAIPLLVPRAPQATAAEDPVLRLAPRTRLVTLGVVTAAFGLFPLAVVAAVPPLRGPNPSAAKIGNILTPMNADVGLAGSWTGLGVRIHWRGAHPRGGRVFYRVFRAQAGADRGIACEPVAGAADRCSLSMEDLGPTRETSFVDYPTPGRWTYRVGVATNWRDDPAYGDVYVVSRAVTVRAP